MVIGQPSVTWLLSIANSAWQDFIGIISWRLTRVYNHSFYMDIMMWTSLNFVNKQHLLEANLIYEYIYMNIQHVTFKSNSAYCDVAVWKPCENKTKRTEKSSNSLCHLWPLTCWDPGTANLRAFHPTYSWHYVVSCRFLQSLLSRIEHQLLGKIRNIF